MKSNGQDLKKNLWAIILVLLEGFARGSPSSVLLAFSQSYKKHDLRKNKIVVPFFCQHINFYELIVKF
jgi:hypothetical protein